MVRLTISLSMSAPTSPNPKIDSGSSPPQRFDTVDILRGVATLAVILTHIFIHTRAASHPLNAGMPAWLEQVLLRNGDNAVHVFFAVSGFLITITSIKRFGSLGGMQPLRFYRIRFARIIPMLLLLLTVLSAMHLAHVEGFVIDYKRETLRGALFSALTFHLNWYEALHGYLPANWGVLWSLSVEEMFYLFFPLLCFGLVRTRRGLWAFIALLLVFVALGPFARTVWAMNRIWRDQSYLGSMDAISLGCLTALLASQRQRRVHSAIFLLSMQGVGLLLLFWMALLPHWSWIQPLMSFLARTRIDRSIVPFATCLVIYASFLRNRTGRAWAAPIRWFGRHSYEVYLTHEFVVLGGTALLVRVGHGPVSLWAGAIVVTTAVLGWLIARFFSEPLNSRLRGPSRPPARLQSA